MTPIQRTKSQKCGIAWDGRYTCRSPICPTCRRRYIRQEQRLNIQRFQDALPHQLADATIKLAATTEVAAIDDIITKGLRDLRNRIHACRRQFGSWNDVTLAGWWIIDAAELRDGQSMWIVSAKTLWFIGDVPAANLRSALQRQWRQRDRVAVRSLPDGAPVEHSLARIIEQANAHRCRYVAPDDGQFRQWPSAWVDELYGWLHGHRRSVWEYLRFNVEPAAEMAAVVPECPVADWLEHAAMPCTF